MTKESLNISATKGSLGFLRWLIPVLLAGAVTTGGMSSDAVLNDRVTKLEEIVTDNTLELSGQQIKLENYTAELVEMKKDSRETREDVKKILIILTRRD